ncbi:MAG: DegT/DnrJ/EryC1/StrS family aminotransferase [Patescibacteria group bacterium]
MPTSKYQWPEIDDEIESEVLTQLRRCVSIYDNSDVFGEFERVFRELHGRRFALLTNSGTSALASIFWSLDLPPDATVVVPAYTFFATFTPLLYRPVRIVLCDCDDSGNITPETLRDVMDDSVRAVVLTHMWGIPADIAAIKAICDDAGALLIEDCSHAHGAANGTVVGTQGYAAAWSLQGAKTITGGEGGVLCTDDEGLYYRSLLYGHYNKRCSSEIPRSHPLSVFSKTGFGLKFRAHPLAIALALALLRRLDSILNERNLTAEVFSSALEASSAVRHAFDLPGRKSWYAFPMVARTPEIAASIMKLATDLDAPDFDMPGSTGDVSGYPLLHSLPLPMHGLVAQVDWTRSRFTNARSLTSRLIKVPVWTMSDRHGSVIGHYAEVLKRVAHAGS